MKEKPHPNFESPIFWLFISLGTFTYLLIFIVGYEREITLDEKLELFERIIDDLEADMVLINPGQFLMGSPRTEKYRSNSEVQHLVKISKPFMVGKYEVRQSEWQSVMRNNPSTFKGDNLPVTNISWVDIKDFLTKLNSRTHGNFRLLTEAEWEYCCRAETKTTYSFGNTISKSKANFNNFYGQPLEVGHFWRPNKFGIHDMHGNVEEFVSDPYSEYDLSTEKDPKGNPNLGNEYDLRVCRGGNYISDPKDVRSASRECHLKNEKLPYLGFRLAKDFQ